jgi:hypothetical protein
MKRISLYKILGVFISAVMLFAACTKDEDQVKLDPILSTSELLDVTSDSATVVGFVVASGSGFSERGVCYDIDSVPTVEDHKVVYTGTSTTATFIVKIGGLAYATKYYARAYAISESGVIYGEEYSFTTLPVVPTLTTDAITSITGNSATTGGNVTIAGGAEVTARGVCYSADTVPTVANDKTVNEKGTGAFVSNLSSLKGNTTYYVRAYATNSAGTGYGPVVTFKTLVDLPVVTTTAITAVTKISAISGGNVTYDGGASVSERGIVYGTSENPTTSDNVIKAGTGTGEFVSNLTGLTLNTNYYVRAYAINSAGTAYGTQVAFTTLADIVKFWIVGSATANGWNNDDNAPYIISTATSNGQAEGYVYLTAGAFKLTTDHSWDAAHTFGDNGSGALTNPGSDINVTSDGYYLLKASQADMTYSLTKTTWGVIGSFAASNWATQLDLTFAATTGIFYGGVHMEASTAFKFRGTSDWGLNYGCTAADGKTLNAGGSDIAVTTAGDYAITLDLSHPNEYTYSANRWGLIGDATAGGWDTSTPMTWDATNKVFTVTTTLVGGKSFKFRANDAWVLNYGGSLSALTEGGGDIAVTADGSYVITLDPWTKVGTLKAAKKK